MQAEAFPGTGLTSMGARMPTGHLSDLTLGMHPVGDVHWLYAGACAQCWCWQVQLRLSILYHSAEGSEASLSMRLFAYVRIPLAASWKKSHTLSLSGYCI